MRSGIWEAVNLVFKIKLRISKDEKHPKVADA